MNLISPSNNFIRKPKNPKFDRTYFRFGTSKVSVETNDPDIAIWLGEFFSPWFSIEKDAGPCPVIQMTCSEQRFSAMSSEIAARTLHKIPCFRLDRDLVCHPGYIGSNDTIVIADGEFGCYYRIRGKHIEVISRQRDQLARIGLMRVVRELCLPGVLEQTGMIDIHAAAFVCRGRAVLLVGPKKTGKTTLLTFALHSHMATLLANDRTLIDVNNLQAFGVPTVVAIRNGTLQMFPVLGRGIPKRAVKLHGGELLSETNGSVQTGNRMFLSLSQFSRQLCAGVTSQAAIGAIVFPELSEMTPFWEFQLMSRNESMVHLQKSSYAQYLSTCTRTVFERIVDIPRKPEEKDDLLRQLTGTVPVVRCLLGKNAYQNQANAWIIDLFRHTETNRHEFPR